VLHCFCVRCSFSLLSVFELGFGVLAVLDDLRGAALGCCDLFEELLSVSLAMVLSDLLTAGLTHAFECEQRVSLGAQTFHLVARPSELFAELFAVLRGFLRGLAPLTGLCSGFCRFRKPSLSGTVCEDFFEFARASDTSFEFLFDDATLLTDSALRFCVRDCVLEL
jgi:hypothetical protein